MVRSRRIAMYTGLGYNTSFKSSSVRSLRRSFLLSVIISVGLGVTAYGLVLVVALWQGFSAPILWALSMLILSGMISCLSVLSILRAHHYLTLMSISHVRVGTKSYSTSLKDITKRRIRHDRLAHSRGLVHAVRSKEYLGSWATRRQSAWQQARVSPTVPRLSTTKLAENWAIYLEERTSIM